MSYTTLEAKEKSIHSVMNGQAFSIGMENIETSSAYQLKEDAKSAYAPNFQTLTKKR